MAEERLIYLRPRSVAVIMSVVVLFALGIRVLQDATQIIIWVLIAAFLALAINPLVEWLQRHHIHRRGYAVAIAFGTVLLGLAGLAAVFVPILIDQIDQFIDAVPGYVEDLTKGRGPFGFLEDDYQITQKVEEAVKDQGAGQILGFSSVALSVTKGVIAAVVAVITIGFMTFFMLLEGPTWVDRFYALMPETAEKRWRAVGNDIYRTVGGYVAGNLLISLIAGTLSFILLYSLGVPYAAALGLLVALLDLVPLAGATVAAVIVTLIAFTSGLWVGVIVLIFFVVYQQLENHLLQPLIYGKTVRLSPLAVLIAVLIGAKLGGIVGALGAIPIAGTIQVVLRDFLRHREERIAGVSTAGEGQPAS